jgi:ABC-type uncharacterized transport system ATPase subunit
MVSIFAWYSNGSRVDPITINLKTNNKKYISIMTTCHLMMGVEKIPETLYTSNTAQTMDNAQQNIGMTQ